MTTEGANNRLGNGFLILVVLYILLVIILGGNNRY